MAERPDVTAIARLVLDQMESVGIDTVLGGALCLGYWATPRGTLDVDVTVFLEEGELHRALDALEAIGVLLDRERAREAVAERGMFYVRLHGIRIDVFLPDIPFYESARGRRRKVDFAGGSAAIWSPEDIVLFKLMFFRSKDRVDIEAVLASQQNSFETQYVMRWLQDLVGLEDERTKWFSALIRR